MISKQDICSDGYCLVMKIGMPSLVKINMHLFSMYLVTSVFCAIFVKGMV